MKDLDGHLKLEEGQTDSFRVTPARNFKSWNLVPISQKETIVKTFKRNIF